MRYLIHVIFNLIFLFYATACSCRNSGPSLKNTTVSLDKGKRVVIIRYDLECDNESKIKVELKASDNSGHTWISGIYPTGDVGFPISPGKSKKISLIYPSAAIDIKHVEFFLTADAFSDEDIIKELMDQVDTMSLINSIREIAGPRNFKDKTSERHLKSVKKYLMKCFEEDGLAPYRQSFKFQKYGGENIVARLKGSSKGRTFVVGAHFDSVDGSPGVDDNGSGVIAVLEIAKILSKYTFDQSITFVTFDLEERGLRGSQEYVKSGATLSDTITGAAIFDMLGYFSDQPNSQKVPEGLDQLFPDAYKTVSENQFRGNFLLSVANQRSADLSLLFDSCSRVVIPDLKVISLVVPGNGEIAPDFRRSDNAPFWDAGLKCLYFGDGANTRNVNYHSPGDVMGTINVTKISLFVKAMLVMLAKYNHIHRGTSVSFQMSKPRIDAR